MSKTAVLALASFLAARCIAAPGAAESPIVKLAFYAPRAFHWADQEDPPVHIVGFENSRSEVRWVVSNTSDKEVESVTIQDEMIPPPACAAKPEHGATAESTGAYRVSIVPHGTAVISQAVHYPR